MYTHVRVNHLKTRGMCNIESKNGDIAFVHFKLFRSSFWEGKVTCLKLTINVTFIYYNPISQKLTYNIVNHLSFPQSKNKKGTAVWLLPVSISVVRKAARFCCC